MKFTKYIYYAAGIYGLIVLLPQYFLEEKNSRDFPPAITHPEYYYGFIGAAVAFQIVFFMIARKPIQYRAIMIPAMLEKFGFVIAVFVLFALGRVAAMMVGLAAIDLLFGVLFIAAFLKTKNE